MKAKRILSIFLAIVMMLGCCQTAFAVAAEEVQGYVSVALTTDKTSYTDDEKIGLKAIVENGTDEAANVKVRMIKTAYIEMNEYKVDFDNVAAGETEEKEVEAKARYFAPSNEKLKLLMDIVLGKIMTIIYRIVAMFTDDSGCATIDVDGHKAAVLYFYEVEQVEEPEETTYTVSFDLNYEGAENNIPSQTVKAGECATMVVPEREGFAFLGWYTSDDCIIDYDFSLKIGRDITLYAKWLNIADETDKDEDAMTDELEKYYNTDPAKDDTDGDGLSDYVECAILKTDPNNADTDSDGVSDGEEDSDEDSLKNISEVEYGTNPANADTDSDRLSDAEELFDYATDPCDVDTDDDGITDGKEIELNTDPLKVDETVKVTETTNSSDSEKEVSVEIELGAEQVETLSITEVKNNPLLPENIPGRISSPFDFKVEGDFAEAILSFEFDADLLENPDFDPVIYYFNEVEQMFEALETIVEGNVAKARTTHFSTYILIDRKKYENSFIWIDNWEDGETYKSAEIVMVIDDSGSLGGDYGYNFSTGFFYGGMDPEHKRLDVARDFVDKANENAKIGIVKFDGVVDNITTGLLECNEAGKQELKDELQFTYVDEYEEYNISGIFDSRGYTYMYSGIERAIEYYDRDNNEVLKVMIVFTDGQAHDTEKHNSVIARASENGIKIYTVGLGNHENYFNNYLKPLSDRTGGKFYLAENASELSEIYEGISEQIDINTDTDEDGIPDYYEDHAVTFNGVKVELDKTKRDTDGDTILDGEELIIKKIENEDKTKVTIIGKYKSNPSKVDSDDDGYVDKEDLNPLVWDVSDRDLAILSKAVYENLPSGTILSGEKITSKLGNDKVAGSSEELVDWKVIDTVYNPVTGFEGAAYAKDNNIVISMRGSESKDLADIVQDWVVADIVGFIIGLNAQLPAMETFIKNLSKNHFNKYDNIYITGHSLGGYLALMAASQVIHNGYKNKIVKVVPFNGLGMSSMSTIGALLDIDDHLNLLSINDRITNYRVSIDVVSLIGNRYGKVDVISLSDTYGFADVIGAHDLSNFLEVFVAGTRKYHGGGGSFGEGSGGGGIR